MAQQGQSASHGLSWEGMDVPISTLFDDPFYARNDGRAEAAYVFLDGNGLPGRWAATDRFAIAELGFGTGLNFLETWRQWRQTRAAGQVLSFTSFEAFPLQADDMARALAVWPELTHLAGLLLAPWREGPGAPGHADLAQRWGPWQLDDQTELTVQVGRAETMVPSWSGTADAWYLDGFSPAKNPAMWDAELLHAVAAKTVNGGTFATYTAAGWVRRNLSAAGFQVEKRPGHGGKREMMFGRRVACLA